MEVVRPQVFSRKMKEVSTFVNTVYLYIRIKITEEIAITQVAWLLLYVQGGIAETWKIGRTAENNQAEREDL